MSYHVGEEYAKLLSPVPISLTQLTPVSSLVRAVAHAEQRAFWRINSREIDSCQIDGPDIRRFGGSGYHAIYGKANSGQAVPRDDRGRSSAPTPSPRLRLPESVLISDV